MTCPACGIAAPDGARFCSSCGHGFEARADERRIATVLFGDLVGFTSLSETRDPETVKNLVDRSFERLAADILAFGGRVDKIVGDAIVALFGAPVAHEDDAERAVRAALQMQATLADLRDMLGIDVRMRIGVNTGEVLVGSISAGDDYTAMGDVVNAAQRLQSAAQPGQVLVGPATHEATRTTIRYEDLGSVTVRGREEAIPAWVAMEAVARPGRRPRLARTRLVGRSSEMAILRGAFDTAVTHRRAHLVLLTGEAGVGKSRVAGELATEAGMAKGAWVLEGHCVPYGEANVWWPIAEALQSACGIEPTDSHEVAAAKCRDAVLFALGEDAQPEQVDAVTAGLLYLMGDERALGDVDPTRARDEVVLALHAALAGLARKHPVLVVLSDIHWADDRVLDLVERLVDRMGHEPLVLITTSRPDLTDRWSPPSGAHNLVRLHLDPLPASAAAELLDELAADLPADLRPALLDRGGGNPFFLEELVALLSEGSPSSLAALPATLRGLVAARVDQLSAAERAVLEDAAVIGRTGSLELLAGLAAARGSGDRSAIVRQLVDRDLLVVLGSEYEFKTDLVREVAYSTLTKGERARRHALVADLLEKRAQEAGREDEQLQLLAHHWGTAAELIAEIGRVDAVPDDVATRALKMIARAAVRAESQDEPLVGIRLLDQALRLLDPTPGRWRWRALLGRAKAHAGIHDIEAALADAATALAEVDVSDDAEMQAEARTVMGEVLVTAGRHDEAAAMLADAERRWSALGDDRGVAKSLRLAGFNDVRRNELESAEPPIRQALALFRDLGDRRGEAWALQHLAWIAFLRGQPGVADERLQKAAAAFREVGDRGGVGWARGLLAWVRFQQGRLDEAEELAWKVLPDSHDRGEKWAAGIITVLLAQVALWRGRAGDAVERGVEALATFDSIGDRFGRCQALGLLARARAAVGDIDGCRRAIDAVREMVGVEPSVAPLADALMGSVAVYLGDLVTIGELVERYGALVPAHDQIVAAERQVALGLALLEMGRVQDAVAALERLDLAEEGHGVRAFRAAPLSLALSAAGRLEEAVAAADELTSTERGTYLDRVMATAAGALARARLGDPSAREANEAARIAIDATDDVVAQLCVRIAELNTEKVLGGDTAALEAEIDARRSALGTDLMGWEVALAAAAGQPTPLSAGR